APIRDAARPRREAKQSNAEFPVDVGNGGIGPGSGEPVAPADNEAGIVAERAARKVVLTAASRDRRAELRQRGCSKQGVTSARRPNGEKEPGIRQPPSDVSRRAHNAGSDGVADGGGYSKPHAQNLKQPAAAARQCGGGIGWARQI